LFGEPNIQRDGQDWEANLGDILWWQLLSVDSPNLILAFFGALQFGFYNKVYNS
jgi:hypothetical protein